MDTSTTARVNQTKRLMGKSINMRDFLLRVFVCQSPIIHTHARIYEHNESNDLEPSPGPHSSEHILLELRKLHPHRLEYLLALAHLV